MTTEQIDAKADVFRECDPSTLLAQIGGGNVLAISGGRVIRREQNGLVHGIRLPVSNGYHVVVDLMANDTYRVRRVFTRRGKDTIHGTVSDVYAEDVGEVAYRASCFRGERFGA